MNKMEQFENVANEMDSNFEGVDVGFDGYGCIEILNGKQSQRRTIASILVKRIGNDIEEIVEGASFISIQLENH